jgi:hypothetical protein
MGREYVTHRTEEMSLITYYSIQGIIGKYMIYFNCKSEASTSTYVSFHDLVAST